MEVFVCILFGKVKPEETFLMKIRKSFLIRWLMSVDKHQEEHSVIDVEHIQSGHKHRVSSLEEASEWMKKVESAPDAALKFSNE